MINVLIFQVIDVLILDPREANAINVVQCQSVSKSKKHSVKDFKLTKEQKPAPPIFVFRSAVQAMLTRLI